MLVLPAWLGLVTLAAVRPLAAQEPDAGPTTSARQNYARTPDTVIPYRDFQEPYLRFFQKVTPFRGGGYDAQEATDVDTVRIGVLAPGGQAPDADLGRELIDGVTLAFEQANAAGGYQGLPFEMVLREDSGLWGGTANEMVTLKSVDDVRAVIGSIDGANTHIALRVALKIEMPMVNSGTTDPTLTETAIPWILRCMADDRQQSYALAHHIFVERGLKTVAAFRVNDRYGRTGIAEFRDAARRLKHPLRVELRWERGSRDFAKQLDRIAQTKPEAVVLWGNAADAAAVVREMRRRNMPQLIFGCDRLVSRSFLEAAGAAAQGVAAVATFDPTQPDPRYAGFLEAFRDRFGREPDAFAAHAFDGANILIESVRKGGLNRVRIRDALHEYRRFDGVTGFIEFDTTLNDIGPVYMATVRDGAFVYERAGFSKAAQSTGGAAPYRTLSEAPPVSRVADVAVLDDRHETFRLGCFLPLDARGQSVVHGLEMALAQDAKVHGDQVSIELVVRDSRGAWGDNAKELTALVVDEKVLALVGSTERRGTHLMETMAARLHLPLITLCDDDPTIHAIPLPWVFSVAPVDEIQDASFAERFEMRFATVATREAAMGYDAGQLLVSAIRGGRPTRAGVQEQLAKAHCHQCVSGAFHFDALGRRVNATRPAPQPTVGGANGVNATMGVMDGSEGSP